MEDKKMFNIIHNNCRKEQLKRHNERIVNQIKHSRKRLKVSVLIAIWFVLAFFVGLIASIDNWLLTTGYCLIFIVLIFIMKKRVEVE